MRLARFAIPLVLMTAMVAMPTAASAAVAPYSITGQVTDAVSGDGVSGICVYADQVGTAQSAGQTHSLAGGVYQLAVPAGDYLVHFIDCRQAPVYASQWYDGTYDREHATPVTVRPLKVAPAVVVNAAMTRGSTVSGTVTDRVTGEPVSGICVTAYGKNIGQPHPGWPTTTTFADGSWALVLIHANWVVDFYDCHANMTYADQWWNDKTSMADADLLTISGEPAQRLTGIDATLDHGATITGRVTDDTTGQPLANICVGTPTQGPRGQTDATGNYTIPNVPSGTWTVEFYECQFTAGGPHYATEYYQHKGTRAGATPVTVTAPNMTVVDETMRVGGVITGRVIDAATGQPIAGVGVSARASDVDGGGGTTTRADGTYTINGLYASDLYRVDFTYAPGSGVNYQEQWWNGATSQDSATYVSVQFNQTASGIDAAMEPQ
ncbi:MAG TPA: carboxypeptidase regulatory-like domain-containing protein [Mycobacteriales bacterium]|nr:carboxypeptidase regulatory-like domain-containing protein [Mycobacteriales bacterium]